MTPQSTALLDRWVTAQRAAGILPRTYTERRRVLERVAVLVDQAPEELTADAIAGYLAEVPTPSTRAAYWQVLRAWFTWLVEDEELRTDNPMARLRRPRSPRRLPRPVTDEQLRQVLATVNRRRTRTWILLGTFQGLRVSEIARVRGEDIDLYEQTLRVTGKGGVVASLPLHPLVADEVPQYPVRGLWFPSYEAHGRGGQPVLAGSVSAAIGATFRRAGHTCNAHQLRHWFGTNTLRSAEGNLRVAQEALRHASVATTALYTKVDDSDVRAAVTGLPTFAVYGDSGPGWPTEGLL